MASQNGQRRAQGGGRTPNSEPKIQLFKDFAGINFEMASLPDGVLPIDVTHSGISSQSDLQMNYVYLQNNVSVCSNKTIETRNEIVKLFNAPEGSSFGGPVCLIGNSLYIASGQDVLRGKIIDAYESTVTLDDDDKLTITSKTSISHFFESFEYYDNKLIGLTSDKEMFTGDVNDTTFACSELENARQVPDPTDQLYGHLEGKGDLVLSQTPTEECPFRLTVAYTYVNKYGPTKISPNTVFYANHPVSEWHTGRYLRITDDVSTYWDITAVELYYATDNASELIFMGRTDLPESTADYVVWEYNWFGYVDATNMWPMANLVVPTENYTTGVKAMQITAIDGRLYFWGDPEYSDRLYIGGNPGNLLSISPGTGGGFVDVEPGTGKQIRYVCKYKTQSGNSIVTLLCDAPNTSKEQRYNLVENSISLSNEQSMKSWQTEQVSGAIGCKSYRGAVVCEDGLYSITRYGLALTTMTMEYNSQIRTNYVSDPIKPVFTDAIENDVRLIRSSLLELDGVLYMAFGSAGAGQNDYIDNVLFCYDIDLKAWWTYTLDIDEPIINLFNLDYEGRREGIGIVTAHSIYVLPTTNNDDVSEKPKQDFLIQTAKLSTQMPQQGWQYLSQLEFHFDYFVGDMHIDVAMVDMFGRIVIARQVVIEETTQYDYVFRMRIDQRVMSYSISMTGCARFRFTHFLARVYTLSNKVGQVWGFDDALWNINNKTKQLQSIIHPRFKDYNDVRDAIFT